MGKIKQIIFAANSFSTGIMLPVLTLVLLEKGASLQTLPLLLAIYSATVLCMELPSGMFADMYGRKAVFLVSCGFYFVSFSALIVAANIIWLIPAIIFFGLGRAFSSGSLDALFIDQAITANGEGCIAKVTTRLAVLESGGIALGGIAGGLVPEVTRTYTGNIILRLLFTAVLFVLCFIFIKEQPLHDADKQKKRTSLIELTKQGKQIISATPKFGLILIGIFFTGFVLFTVETYWQPAFMKISAARNSTWVLGIITFIGYFTVIFGNSIAKKFLDHPAISWWNVYNIFRVIMAAIFLAFAFQKNAVGFISLYAGIYLLLGAANVAESALINKYTPNQMRASMLSLNSLIAQVGGLCASLFSSIMVIKLRFSGIWATAGLLLGAYAIFMTAVTNVRKEGRKRSQKEEAEA